MFHISFDFDQENKKLSNVKIIDAGYNADEAIIKVEDNKLTFTESAVNMLGLTTNDRVSINYFTVDAENTFPVIGKSELFTDQNDGNRFTKSNTISYRGEQRKVLLEYGSIFKLEPFNNYFKMVKVETEEENSSNKNINIDSLINITE